jgi:hypothetical protein
MSFLGSSTIIPFTFVEVQDGYRLLVEEGLAIPEYKVDLSNIPNCKKSSCYVYKLNTLQSYDPVTFASYTASLSYDFVDEYICPDHLLPNDPRTLFVNNTYETDYIYCAASLVKLSKCDFKTPVSNIKSEPPMLDKELPLSRRLILKKFIKQFSELTSIRFLNLFEGDKVRLVEKAKRGESESLNELRLALDFLLVRYQQKNQYGVKLISNTIQDITTLYGEFNLFYRGRLTAVSLLNDFNVLSSRFNQRIKSLFVELAQNNNLNSSICELDSIYTLISRNFSNLVTPYGGGIDPQVIVSLKNKPDQNSLFTNSNPDANPLLAGIFLLHELFQFPETSILYEQGRDSVGNNRALYKIRLFEYYNIYLFFDSLIDSKVYPIKSTAKVLDATVLWSTDVNSPFYHFDKAYDTISTI